MPQRFERKADAGSSVGRGANSGHAAIPHWDVAHVSQERRDILRGPPNDDVSL